MNTRRRALSDGCSAFNSARAAATSGRFCSAACRVFFEGDIVTLIESPDRAPPVLSFYSQASRARISSSVRSGSAATRSSSHRLCVSSGERLWPVPGFAATLPVFVQRSNQRIAVETPISSRRAVSRLLSPASTIPTTRARRSFEYPFAIVPPPLSTQNPNLICARDPTPRRHYDSHQEGSALESLIDSFVEQLSQVFMLRVFHVGTIC